MKRSRRRSRSQIWKMKINTRNILQ